MPLKLILAIATTCGGLLLAQRTPDVQLRAAEHMETVEGNVKAAIDEYRKLAQGADRVVAAKALLRLGRAYENLGNTDARAAYERVARQFADQKAQAAEARQRLALLTPSSPARTVIATRQLWTGRKVDTGGTVSPDGRYLSFTDWSTGDLAIRDLTANTDRRLTDKGTFRESRAYAERSAISRDGKLVAFAWFDGEDHYQLRVTSLQAESAAAPRVLLDNSDVQWISPFDWSPDNKSIAAQIVRKDGVSSIALVSATDGSVKVLKTIEWRGTSKIAFSPDGKYIAYDLPVSSKSAQRDIFILAVDGSRETRAVEHGADDRVVGWSPDGRLMLFTSQRTASVSLWALNVFEGSPAGTPTLIKNDFGPGRPLAVTSSGTLYYGSKTAGPDIYVASVDFSNAKLLSTPTNPAPTYTGSNQHPHWSPDGNFLAYISRRDSGGLNNVLCILSRETGEVRDVKTEMAYVNRPRWAPDGRSIAVMGTDLKGHQGLFRVDVQSGAVSPLAVAEPGVNLNIIDWSSDGKKIFFTRPHATKGWSFIEREVASGAEREIAHRSDLQFGLTAASPDRKWFASPAIDRTTKAMMMLVISVGDGQVREVLRSPKYLGLAGWTPDSTSLIVNRPGTTTAETVRVPISGGEPVKLSFSIPSAGTPFSVHPDGRQVAYWAGAHAMEVWALENFLPTQTARRD